jgi:F0F1-type ATP synthase membrane subunit b/b'
MDKMNGLQEAFYIMGIVFMSLTFILILALLSAVLVIRSKVNKIHDNIDAKINTITTIAEKGGEISALAGSQVLKQAKKAFKNEPA